MEISIFLTQNCNFHCNYCLNKCPKNEEIPLEKYIEVLDILKPNLDSVFFTGGEPILHSKFNDIIKETINRNLKFSLVSNGYFYEKYANLINLKDYFSKIFFSLNGLKETHDSIRGKGSFEKVIKAIKYFSGKGIDVVVNLTIMPSNIEQIELIIKLLSKLKVNSVRFGAVVSNGINNGLVINNKERNLIYWDISRLSRKYNLLLKCSPSLFSTGGVEFCLVFGNKKHLYVNQKGELIYCCNIREPLSSIGEINKSSLKKILNKRELITSKIRDDRTIKLINNSFSIEEEHTCKYCNLFFKKNKMNFEKF